MTLGAVPDPARVRTNTPTGFREEIERLVGRPVETWADLDVIERALVRRLPGYVVGRPLPLDLIGGIDSLEEVLRLSQELEPAEGIRHVASEGPATDYVHLREWRIDDMPAVYAAAISPVTGTSWRFQGATPSMEDFSRTFGRDTLATHVVASNDGDTAIGTVSCFSPSFDNGWAYIGFQRCAVEAVAELMFEGIFAFISWIFETWTFRRVYAEINGGLMAAVPSLGLSAGEECGVLPEHSYRLGGYEDVHIVAFTRKRWSEFRRSIGPLLTVAC